jgi:hypothetical protein
VHKKKKNTKSNKMILFRAILMLQENGVLHKLKTKWWKQKGALNCEVSSCSTVIDPHPDCRVRKSRSGSSKAKMILKTQT